MNPRSPLVKRTIRRLKRRWPTSIVLKQRERGAIDIVTGQQTVVSTPLSIRRAVLLPQSNIGTFVYDLAYLSGATSNMTQGGHFVEGMRYILLDGADLGAIVPRIGDEVIAETFSAEVTTVQEMDRGAGYILRTREIVGVKNVT